MSLKKNLFLCLAVFLTSLSAFASPNSTKPYDLTFIDELTEHHTMGIEMAKMAMEKGSREKLRDLAEKMVEAQTSEIEKMRSWRKQWFPEAAPYESHAVSMRMEELERLSGNAFDVAFLDSMIMHHPGAIYLGHEVQSRGQHVTLKSFGKKIASVQIKELNLMRHWRHHWHSDHDEQVITTEMVSQ